MKKISVITPCYNEEGNVQAVYEATKAVFAQYSHYDYEHVFIDNCSEDNTVKEIKAIAARDPKVKLIVNARNFGHIRSPYHALLQVDGDAAIPMAADLQDPPELIHQFIKKWEEGFKLVAAVKNASDEPWLYFQVRKLYYKIVNKLADVDLIPGFHGYGLLDRVILNAMKKLKDPYPYLRGIVCEIGFPREVVHFHQPTRKVGFTKNNLYSLYDLAMTGMVNHSKVPLRMAIFVGFGMAILSFLVALAYLIYKIIYWYEFSVGMAPLIIGIFLFSSVQLIFLGIVGEYMGSIFSQVKDRPLVIEKERVNF